MVRLSSPMPTVFLDTNVYNYAAADGQADAVRAWLDGNGFCAVASVVNLIELARTGDRVQAMRLVRALTRIAREHEEPPFTMLLADEFLAAVQRHRPVWVRASGWAGRGNRLQTYRRKWEAVRGSPEQAFVGLAEFDRQHRPLEQGLHDQQSQLAELRRDRKVISVEIMVAPALRQLIGDQLADRVERLPAAERFVRLVSLEDWRAALLPNASARNDLREWVDGHLNSVDERALAEFWLVDLWLNIAPHHSIRGLVRQLQSTRTVKESNRNDLDLASWLLRVELVLTADKCLGELLLQAREQLRVWAPSVPVAKVGLVRREGDALASVQRAVAAAR